MSYVDRITEKINPDQLLHQIGLRRASEVSTLADTVLPAIAIFGAGLLVGAGIALMATPKSGREMREDISRRAGELGERVRSKIPPLPGSEDYEGSSERNSSSRSG